ncbi:uncharacterized protein BXZ73DRAFT_46932 [Epithele typhae]|uniref:uncharacterized protein n=1 Tax=Epithele typhae TaxID=378194 RepID=UPI00200822A4|nr:uncharacterized protein BXZ73DRAFT_46932 [Epithele typhae]KAH9932139.1 hypothetical protein BXZ73DRAFT_46932 [Epithele typhae]
MSTSRSPHLSGDSVTQFFIEANRVITEARFLISSIPNADRVAALGFIRQLQMVHTILQSLDDPLTTSEEKESLSALRLWRDVRKDSLETFRQIFMHLEAQQLLDMNNNSHRVCLFLVFHKRIQDSLDRSRQAWNSHKLRTEHNMSPHALYELSKEEAIQRGYWTGDPGDPAENIDSMYGVDDSAPIPPADDIRGDPTAPRQEPSATNPDAQKSAGIMLNTDEEIEEARRVLHDVDMERDDSNWGIEVYIEALTVFMARVGSI